MQKTANKTSSKINKTDQSKLFNQCTIRSNYKSCFLIFFSPIFLASQIVIRTKISKIHNGHLWPFVDSVQKWLWARSKLQSEQTAEFLSSQLMIGQNAREGDTKTKNKLTKSDNWAAKQQTSFVSCLHFNFPVFFSDFRSLVKNYLKFRLWFDSWIS